MLATRGLHAMSRLLFGPRFPLPGGAARGVRLKTQFPIKTNIAEIVRNLPNRIVATLEAPATGRFAEQSRALHTSVSPNITQRLSLPARLAINRPLAAPRLPKVAAVPRGITDVGLGAARNFSSRPVFQHLVENVPIVLRSAAELDLDPRVRKSKAQRIAGRPANKKARASRRKALAPATVNVVPTLEASIISNFEAELAHYFPAAASSTVTLLTIPLQPVASRSPLPEPRQGASPLDLASFVPTISAYQNHRLRVDSLFDRMARANVWKCGASTTAQCTGSGVADAVQVQFDGWSAADVKAMLGHAGEGWCTIEERTSLPIERNAAQVEDEWNTLRESIIHTPIEDSQVTLVLPTLDFSARVLDQFDHAHSASIFSDLTRPPSPLTEFVPSDADSYFHSFTQSDGMISAEHDQFSDFGSDSDFDTATWSSVSHRF